MNIKEKSDEGLHFENRSYTRSTQSDDIMEIIMDTDIVLEAFIERVEMEGMFDNGSTYECRVLRTLKGDPIATTSSGTIHATLIKDSVQVGDSYVVMLNRVNNDSLIYYQSALKGVFSLNDQDSLSEILQTLDMQ